MDQTNTITVQTTINAPVEKVWEYWNKPEHITKWAFASDDWEAPEAENDLREGGAFRTKMAAKDKSQSFDFTGTYTKVGEHEIIEYTMDDPLRNSLSPPRIGRGETGEASGRKVSVRFEQVEGNKTKITETFDPENENPEEMQRSGWQAILDNFKKYVESNT